MENINNNQLKGIIWMIIHCLAFATMNGFVRYIAKDIHVVQIMFLSALLQFIIIAAYMRLVQKNKNFSSANLPLHATRGFLGAISMCLYFYALTLIDFAQTQAIGLTYPLMTTILAFFLLKEKIGWHRCTALFIGFVGALVIIKPSADGFDYAVLYVLLATFMWGVTSIVIKILSRTEGNLLQLFYLNGFVSLFLLPAAIYFWTWDATMSTWLILIVIGFMGLLNSSAIFIAFKNADLATIMPFDFSTIVFAAIIAWVAFDEIIAVNTVMGSVIIVASASYIAHREARQQRK